MFQNLSRKTKLKSTRGNICKALKIFAMALKFMKDHLLKAVAKQVDRYTKLFTFVLNFIIKHLLERVVNKFHSKIFVILCNNKHCVVDN